MVKAIIFDCFGVLTTEAWQAFKAKHFGHDPELMRKAVDISNSADLGMISRNDALVAVAELAGMTPSAAAAAIDRYVPNEPLFERITKLKQDGYKLGFLSNVSGDDYLKQIFKPEQVALFDALTMSYKTGYVKPQPEAFAAAAEQLGLTEAECVLVDDQERNVSAARDAGMQGIWYQDFDQFQADLEKLLADSKS